MYLKSNVNYMLITSNMRLVHDFWLDIQTLMDCYDMTLWKLMTYEYEIYIKMKGDWCMSMDINFGEWILIDVWW